MYWLPADSSATGVAHRNFSYWLNIALYKRASEEQLVYINCITVIKRENNFSWRVSISRLWTNTGSAAFSACELISPRLKFTLVNWKFSTSPFHLRHMSHLPRDWRFCRYFFTCSHCLLRTAWFLAESELRQIWWLQRELLVKTEGLMVSDLFPSNQSL